MVTKGKLAIGLASAGAVMALLPASASAGGISNRGLLGLTHAYTVLLTNPDANNALTGDPDEGGQVAVFGQILAHGGGQ